MTNFDKVAASPETLGKFLSSIPIATGPWDELFHRQFCDDCERECDVEHCPHQAERGKPTWWLMQEAGPEVPLKEMPEPLRELKETFPAVKIYRETHTSGTMKGKLQFLECGAGLMMELGKLLFPDMKKYRAIIECDPVAGVFEVKREDIVSESPEQKTEGQTT